MSETPPVMPPRRTRRSGVAAVRRHALRVVARASESARAHRRTVAVVLGAALGAFLLAWWLSPGGSSGMMTTVGSPGVATAPAPAPATATATSDSATAGPSTPGAATARVGPGETAAEGRGGGSAGSARSLFVHVSGAVVTPGLVEVPDGARVFDAVAKAGGVTAEAREGGVNLARFVVDGEQILVPRADDPAAAGAASAGASSAASSPATGSGGSSGTAASGSSGAGGKVNLNTATAADLETLPRVGPSMSAKILEWRAENGAFSTIEDLNDVDGIGDKTFESLKDLVTL